jgi:hypothetical protein
MRPVQERPSPPPASRPSLEGVVATMLLDAAATEVTAALRRNQIPSRLLKGAAIAAWLYDGADRTYVDVDLLIAPRDLERAEKVLVQLGFSPADGAPGRADRPRHARVWEREGDAAAVDLHTRLAGVGIGPQEAWDVLAAAADETVVGGETVETLDVPARALHVVLHAAQHGTRSPQALADLDRALSQLPLETWRESEALARRLDALPAFVAGLSLATEGDAVARRLGLSRVSSIETELRVGVAREEALGSALGFEWLAGSRGLRERAAFVASKVAPPPAWMRRRSALARRGYVGLMAAYVLRLGRLAPHTVAGFLAWRRARRAAR